MVLFRTVMVARLIAVHDDLSPNRKSVLIGPTRRPGLVTSTSIQVCGFTGFAKLPPAAVGSLLPTEINLAAVIFMMDGAE
jgi:hypothetical protein